MASEIKAFASVDTQVHEVDPGHHGWADPEAGPDLAPYVDLLRLGQNQPPIGDPDEAARRMPTR